MPAADSGVTVTASLDGAAVTISGTGGITIQPATLAVGAHVLAVVFTNQAGADTATASFRIDSAVTPVVELTSNPASLSTTTQQVMLMATDLSGGGSEPLYTFAKDAGFSAVIQAESAGDSVALPVSTLAAG